MNLLRISIEGTLMMLDDATPHVAVPVQAIYMERKRENEKTGKWEGEEGRGDGEMRRRGERWKERNSADGQLIATTLSDGNGKYQFINLKPGQYQVRCQVLGGYVYYGEEEGGRGDKGKRGQGERGDGDILRVESGKALKDIDFRFAPFKKGIWRNYSYLEGLTNDGILAIYCEPDGVMWFGSHIGVFRYDGKEFVHFTTKDGLGHGHVHPIGRDLDGMMWFGTWGGGVSRYDGKEFVTFTTEDGLLSNLVFAIHCDRDGVLWFGTYAGGVSRYDGKTFVNFTTEDGLASNSVSAIHGDPDGVIWFGTWGGGVSRYDGKEFVNLTTEDGLAHNRIAGNHSIHGDPDGVIWFGTNGGVSRYDGKEFVNFTTADGLVHNTVWAIHRDPDGVMWFGTNGGVSRYDGNGFVNFTTEDGLAHNMVMDIHSDPDGVMWFATRGGGVSRYDPKAVHFTTKDGLVSNRVNAMHRDPDGVMWLGTDGGVSRYDGKEFVNFTTEDGLAHNSVTAIDGDQNGVLWFGTDGCCVSRYDGKEFVNFSIADGLGHSSVCIHRDPDGVLWFGIGGYTSDWLTVGGVFRYDGKEFVNLTTEAALAQNYVNDIHREPNGIMWFATGATLVVGGLSRYDGKEFVTFTTQDGLPHNNVEVIHRDPDGVLWFGTWDGVARYDGKGLVNFAIEDGLVGNSVFAIHRDLDGILWFGTGNGVSGYDGVAWTSLDARDGLAGHYIGSILQDTDGFLWFATGDGGVTRYRRSITPPRVYIVSVTTDQKYRLKTEGSGIPAFTIGTRVTIEYDSIDLKTVPEKRQYRCRVYETGDMRRETSDSSLPYNPPTRETSFDWIPEKPGTYIFQVQAIDRDLNYSEPASVELIAQPDPVLVSMKTELSYLRSEVRSKYHFENIIGRSTGVREVRALMERAIDSGLTVLITGETGTGKELVAKAIHHNSPRRDQPILALNCGAVPKELIASSLFGHRKGAFTSAHEDQLGLFEAASGGTVLLDEIGEMPRDAQIQLLRVLEERVVQRIGEHTSREVDVRIMAMTNRDLMNEVTKGQFREDLYYRLSVFPIHIPPLRERVEDIPTLAEHFLHEYSQEQKKDLDGFAPDVLQMLQSYDWPGNVRELRNVIQRAAALAQEGDRIQTYHLPPQITHGEPVIQEILSEQMNLSTAVDHVQRRLVENALRECNGNRAQAARMLGLHRSNLVRLMKRLGIE